MKFALRLLSAALVAVATLVLAAGALLWAVASLLKSLSSND